MLKMCIALSFNLLLGIWKSDQTLFLVDDLFLINVVMHKIYNVDSE